MATKRAYSETFIEGTIHIVSEVGIENMRTKQVADYAGFSEATLFRLFDSKDKLLIAAFLQIDKKVSSIFSSSDFVKNVNEMGMEKALYDIWHTIYRYLVENRQETLYLIRFRYSSLYSNEVRAQRQAYNGAFEPAFDILESYFGKTNFSYRGFLISYIFEMTLCFAEKILTGRIEDTPETEQAIWLAVSTAVKVVAGSNKKN